MTDEQITKIKASTFNTNARRIQQKDYCDILCARDWKDPKCVVADYRYDEGLRIRKNGLSSCLTTKIGYTSLSGNTLLIKNNTKKGYLEATDGDGVYISNIDKKRGTVQKEMIPTLKTSPDIGVVVDDKTGIDITWNEVGDTTDVARTLTTACRTLSKNQMTTGVLENNLRIRKLTPKECWRLMGFDDEDFEKAEKVNSNTQLYKQAGNSICVPVLEAILSSLLNNDTSIIYK